MDFDEDEDLDPGSLPLVVPALFHVETSPGEVVLAYCIDVDKTAIPGPYYEGTTSKMNPSVAWVVQNSYPALSLAELEAASGVTGLSVEAAITATNMVIWKLTGSTKAPDISFDYWDEYRVIGGTPPIDIELGEQVPETELATARALYNFLLQNAESAPEPATPTLELTGDGTGQSGSKLGPLTVTASSTLDNAVITFDELPAGVSLVDAEGNAISSGDSIAADAQIFAIVDEGVEPGSVTFTIAGNQTRPAGTSLRGHVYDFGETSYEAQPLILAQSDQIEVSVEGQFSWTGPEPTPTPTPTETTSEPNPEPTDEPTGAPTDEPTVEPTDKPTVEPSAEPTDTPSVTPTASETQSPIAKPASGSGPLADTGLNTGMLLLIPAGLLLLLGGAFLVRRAAARN